MHYNTVPSHNFTSLLPFEAFDSRKEKFTAYIEHFENYISLKGITDFTKKAQLLCSSIGQLHYNSLAAFLGPEKVIKDMPYNAFIENLKTFLMPWKSVNCCTA